VHVTGLRHERAFGGSTGSCRTVACRHDVRVDVERYDDVTDRWPGQFAADSDRDVSVLTISSGRLLEPRLTLAGDGSFD
jgi:hypothetical protein